MNRMRCDFSYDSSRTCDELKQLDVTASLQAAYLKAISFPRSSVEVERLCDTYQEIIGLIDDIAYRQGLSDGVQLIIQLLGA